MKPAFWARRAHKWIALVVGVQALLWMLSGLYMTAISIDVIHGDHLAHANAKPLSASGSLLGPDALAKQYPGLGTFQLKRLMDREVYELRQADNTTLIDARSGARLSPLSEAMARQLAQSLYRGKAPIRTAELVREAPQGVATRPVPMWRVEFADNNETTRSAAYGCCSTVSGRGAAHDALDPEIARVGRVGHRPAVRAVDGQRPDHEPARPRHRRRPLPPGQSCP